MRVLEGLGLVGILGFVACSASPDTSGSAQSHDTGKPSQQPNPGSLTSDTSPTEPPPDSKPTDKPEDAQEPPAPLASGITVSDIAVFQAVKVPVVEDGKLIKPSQRKAPVGLEAPRVASGVRDARLGLRGTNVTAELRLVSKDRKFPVIRDRKAISGASEGRDPQSTLNLELPADSLPDDVTFQVSLTTPDAHGDTAEGTDEPARFPRDGSFESLGAEASGKVRVVVVPVKYNGLTPSVADEEIAAYKKNLMRFYPASEIEITAHAPYTWNQQISSNGSGFPDILRAITQLRSEDQVDKDVYYYGLLRPKDTMNAYCGGGCVTGLSSIVDNPQAAGMRASVGIGFDGIVSANTMAHELGHAHGRQHAPCGGPQGPDPRFPYSAGGIGVWGYDIFAKALVSPKEGKDIMGYCQNLWISDYTYAAIFDRIVALRGASDISPPYAPPAQDRYRIATANGDGDLTWNGELDLEADSLDGAVKRQAKFLGESGDIVLRETRISIRSTTFRAAS